MYRRLSGSACIKEITHVSRRSFRSSYARRGGMEEEAKAAQKKVAYEDHAKRTSAEPRQAGLHKVSLGKITPVNQTIKLFKLSIASGLEEFKAKQFQPGQWVDLHIPGIRSLGGFTITSAPSSALDGHRSAKTHGCDGRKPDPHIELAVQLSPNPPAQWLFQPPCKILNTTLHVRAGGSFVYPPRTVSEGDFKHVKRVVMVAGGVGINPLMSMLRSMEDPLPQVELLYAVRKPLVVEGGFREEHGLPTSGVLFLENLLSFASIDSHWLSMKLYLTGNGRSGGNQDILEKVAKQPNVEVYDGRRWKHKELEAALGEQHERDQTVAYVCGPPKMTDEVVEVLRGASGMKEDWVFCEKWW